MKLCRHQAHYETCIICTETRPLEARIEQLEAHLERVRDLAIKPMSQGGWTLESVCKELNALLYPAEKAG